MMKVKQEEKVRWKVSDLTTSPKNHALVQVEYICLNEKKGRGEVVRVRSVNSDKRRYNDTDPVSSLRMGIQDGGKSTPVLNDSLLFNIPIRRGLGHCSGRGHLSREPPCYSYCTIYAN